MSGGDSVAALRADLATQRGEVEALRGEVMVRGLDMDGRSEHVRRQARELGDGLETSPKRSSTKPRPLKRRL